MRENFQYLERASLFEKLAKAEDVPMLLVTAPMGYGKTTAVRRYLEKNSKKYIWITLGQTKVREEWWWNRVIQGFETEYPSLTLKMRQIGLPYSGDREMAEEKLLSLFHEDIENEDLYLVLDEYQSCEGDEVNNFLTRMAYEDIKGFHLILISRSNIHMAIEELRMKGYCEVVGQESFMMTREETRQLFEINGISLDSEQITEVCDYTDGWIAAAGLLRLDYQKDGSLKSTGSVQRLLRESVYDRLSKEEKEILYLLSCFPELSIEELKVVCGHAIGEQITAGLMEKTGLVHFDIKNEKFSVHTLLHGLVTREENRDIQEIYRRYARYRMEKGDETVAIFYFAKAADREAVMEILDGENRFEIMEQIPEFLLNFFQECADGQELLRHPYATLSFLYIMLMSADTKMRAAGKRFYYYVREYYETSGCQTQAEWDLLGEFLIVEALDQYNDVEAANEALCKAWEVRQQKPSKIFAKRVYSYGVPNTLSMYHNTPGKLKEAMEGEITYSKQYMRLMYQSKSSLETVVRAEYDLETGKCREAFVGASEALEKAEFYNQTCIIITCYQVMMRSYIMMGNKRAFDEAMAKCGDHMKDVGRKMLISEYDLLCGYVYAVIGQLDRIPPWLRQRQLENCNLIVRDNRNACIIYGLYLCRKKHWVQLTANAEEMMISYAGTRHVFAEVYAGIFYAIALWNTKRKEEARSYFMEIVEMAELDGIRMPFGEMSEELLPLLESMEEAGGYVLELTTFCREWQKGIQAFRDTEYKEPVFTPREKEVLEYVSQGYRNSEISKMMNIAQVTVEKNLTSIYRKIGVMNRTGAVKWYNENRG